MSLKPHALWMPALSGQTFPVEQLPPPGFRPAWIEVHWSRLDRNLQVLRSRLPSDCAVMAVVKDNAYGHGICPVARRLEPAVEMLAVSLLEEALLLRQSGVRKPVLILGGLAPGQEAQALQQSLVPAVFSLEALRRWNDAAAQRGPTADFHLKVDTGMNRLGLLPGQLEEFLAVAGACRHAACAGLMTHLASADLADSPSTSAQLRVFDDCLARVVRAGIRLRWIHAANSAGILDHPNSHYSLVRPGIALYGYDPQPSLDRGLQPVLELKAGISLVKVIPAGSRVGYGGTFVTRRETRLATVPIGYGDGISRRLSNRGEVLVQGRRLPIVGRVSMDSLTVDATGLPGVEAGQEVVFLGRSGAEEIHAGHLAQELDTIPYEILTSLSPRLSRAYLD